MSHKILTTHRYKDLYASYTKVKHLLSWYHVLISARNWLSYIWVSLINDINTECHQTQYCTCNQKTIFMHNTQHNQTLQYISVCSLIISLILSISVLSLLSWLLKNWNCSVVKSLNESWDAEAFVSLWT